MTSNDFLKSLKWKREYKSDRKKYLEPFYYHLNSQSHELIIEQTHFQSEGFASTVWDSSIVMSKFLEKYPDLVNGKHCLDLSAGCGLVATVISNLKPLSIVATDLASNLKLLSRNCEKNAFKDASIEVVEYCWGETLPKPLQKPFHLIVACDVMYSSHQVPQLVASLCKLTNKESVGLVCYGRNASGEELFLNLCQKNFNIRKVSWLEFDPIYRSEEISCFYLTRNQF